MSRQLPLRPLALFRKEGASAEAGDLIHRTHQRRYLLHNHLPVKLQRIVAEELIPEAVFVSCRVVAQFSGKWF